ncbi:hypothetical protein GHK86_14415 [Acidimicrobiaceae bacterium USS-CC1]|uniref:UGSC-like domain-containing protein n=1 Tax=Acidiferrimicrobium australe TaxID=2664430 RepID=A0ABW9QW36_9ACTN|nr:hypothetical protein [Acidiferrimicrobium australe]
MYDIVRFERRGIPAVAVATEPFVDEAIEQARLLAMDDCRVVYVPHPVQLLTPAELRERAVAAFPAVVAALTSGRGPDPS